MAGFVFQVKLYTHTWEESKENSESYKLITQTSKFKDYNQNLKKQTKKKQSKAATLPHQKELVGVVCASGSQISKRRATDGKNT